MATVDRIGPARGLTCGYIDDVRAVGAEHRGNLQAILGRYAMRNPVGRGNANRDRFVVSASARLRRRRPPTETACNFRGCDGFTPAVVGKIEPPQIHRLGMSSAATIRANDARHRVIAMRAVPSRWLVSSPAGRCLLRPQPPGSSASRPEHAGLTPSHCRPSYTQSARELDMAGSVKIDGLLRCSTCRL
jgi:hypothetical protein